jgi:hypothetical protein
MSTIYSLQQYIDDLRLIGSETEDENEIFRNQYPVTVLSVDQIQRFVQL